MKNTKMHRSKILRFFSLLGIFLFVSICAIEAIETKASLQDKIIKVGVYNMPGFCEIDSDGNLTGYNIDYLAEISNVTGWKYQYIPVESFKQGLLYLEKKEIDLLAPCQLTQERQVEYDFSSYSFGTEYTAMIAKTDSTLSFEDYESFKGIRVAVAKGYLLTTYYEQYEKQHGFSTELVYYNTPEEALEAAREGIVDAAVANLIEAEEQDKVLARFEPKPFYYMTWKGNTELLHVLDQAMLDLQTSKPDLQNELEHQYFTMYAKQYLSVEQKQYVEKVGPITVGYLENRLPLSYKDSTTGELQGITRKILDRIQEITGLSFQYEAIPNGEITYSYLQEHQIKLVSGVEYNKTNLHSNGLLLSSSYLHMTKVIIGKENTEFDKDTPFCLAVNSGSQSLVKEVQAEYPNFTVVKFDTLDACFHAVEENQADFVLVNQYIADHWMSKPKYENLKTIPAEGFADNLCIAALNSSDLVESNNLDYDMLIDIINLGISQITEEELNSIIVETTFDTKFHPTVKDFLYEYRYIIVPGLVGIVLFILLLIMIIHLKKKNYRIIQEEEAKLKSITNNINGGVMVLVPELGFRIAYANMGLLDILGYSEKEAASIIGTEYITYVNPEDKEKLHQLLQNESTYDKNISFRLSMQRKDGSYVNTLFSGTLSRTEQGEVRLYCVIMDLTEQLAVQEKLFLQQERYRLLIEQSEEIVYELNLLTGNVEYSDNMLKKMGWDFGASVAEKEYNQISSIWLVHEEDQAVLDETFTRVRTEKAQRECTVRLRGNEGTYQWFRVNRYPVLDKKNQVVSIIGKIDNVDAEIREKARLKEQTRLDGMTGLLNKQAFMKEVKQIIQDSDIRPYTLIFIDLDHFKSINDQLGHQIGDQAIKDAAIKLRLIFQENALVSRFGGDEFCIFLYRMNMEQVKEKLENAVIKMRERYTRDEVSILVTASIGAVYQEEGELDRKELMELADQAVYEAKEKGRNQYCFREGV